ncbi:MAG: hypothetical protein PHV82_06805, partial [Victivallaceae bacterium]|nr:hypothetical protein [Victivallaceae bacterium]
DYSGANAATVIQAAINNLSGPGSIYLDSAGTFTITSKITAEDGQCIFSNGALLDVSGLNDTVFEFSAQRSGNNQQLTGIWGFKVQGNIENSDLLLFKATNINYSVVVRDIFCHSVPNVIHLVGSCFMSHIENVHSLYSESGTFIKLEKANEACGPNGTQITNCSAEPQITPYPEYSLYVKDAGSIKVDGFYTEGVFDTGCYFENSSFTLTNSKFSGNSYFVVKNVDSAAITKSIFNTCKISIQGTNEVIKISDNLRLRHSNSSCITVEASSTTTVLDIANNNFETASGQTAITIVNGTTVISCLDISHNVFRSEEAPDQAGTAIMHGGGTPSINNAKLIANTFEYLTGTYIVYLPATQVSATNNIFKNVTATSYILLIGSGQTKRTSDNIFVSISGTLMDYRGLNCSAETFSGDGSTTSFSFAHGLAATPTHVEITPTSADAAANFYWSANGTNIIINYLTAPPAGTNNVKFTWRA